ncbi:ankyrin repeat-containing domain protein [Paraphoma chrysanthemicola]|uniref:Ankyrin repeat-containing domain protein n=1 Tax=Paraphoma chrysanthemicola TaxID=798071 RepID=A0A8K0RMG5_9PLEO|nr:ankyrin repeat-containing domain protein [Paraphoma chrysanthemicola]
MPLILEHELLQAIREEDITAVRRLLENGADPNAGLFGTENSISIALETGNEDILDLLLNYGPFCCMTEENAENRPYQIRVTRPMLVRTLAYNFAKIVATKFCLRVLATSAVGGHLEYVAFWAYHYYWIVFGSLTSGTDSLHTLRERYRSPWWYIGVLLDILIGHQLYGCIDRRVLTMIPNPLKSPSLAHDFLVVLPLRICLDGLVVIGRKTLTTMGILKPRRRTWIGDDICLALTEHWHSPAERVTRLIATSDKVKEEMVLKLLRSDMLASRPYKDSLVAAELFCTAVDRCWTQVTSFLLREGALVDHEPSEILLASRMWPWAENAVRYCLPGLDCQYLSAPFFKDRHIEWPYWRSASSFIELVRSSRFQSMASSQSHSDHTICKEMLSILQDHKADPLLTNSSGLDALSHLSRSGCSSTILQSLAVLWKEARQHLQCPDESQSRALHHLVSTNFPNLEIIQILLDAGVSPDWEDSEGRTPLFAAAYMNRNTEAMELLLKAGANPNNGGSTRYPPILRTLDDANLDKFEFLLDRGASPNAVDKEAVACRSFPAIAFSLLTVFKLLSLGAETSAIDGGATALLQIVCSAYRARGHEYKADLRYLISSHAVNLNAIDSTGISPLHHTINNNSRDFSLVLLDYSADPNIVDSNGYTALQRICSQDVPTYSIARSFDEIERIVNDPRYAGVRGQAVWRHVRRSIYRDIQRSLEQEEVFQALAEHAANLGVLDLQGRSLLMLASEKGNAVLTANILYCLGPERFDQAVYITDNIGQTAVHLAAINGNVDTLRILLWRQNIMHASQNAWRQMAVDGEDDYQARHSGVPSERFEKILKAQIDDYAGKMATVPSYLVASTVTMEHWDIQFTIGCERRRNEERMTLPNVSTSTWTLQESASTSLRGDSWHDELGRTPLHYAAERGHIEAVRLFLDHTAVDIDVKDRNGKRAVDLALENDFYNVYSAITTREAEL